MRKKLIIVTGVTLLGSILAAGVAASLLINIDRFRPQLARTMSAALGRDVAIGHISLSVLSGSATVEDLAIADDPAFGQTPFVTARAVRVGIALLPLVTSKHLRIESFRLQEPRVILRRSAAGTWNFSTLGLSSSAAPATAASSSSNLTLSIDRLAIARGQVVFETTAARTSRAVYDDLTVDLRDFSPTSRFRFAVSAATPAGGTLKSSGSAGPFSATGLGSTPFDATIDAARIDLVRSGLVDPGASLAGIIDLHLRIASNGVRINTSGTLRGDKLQLVPGASAATRPVEIRYASNYDLSTHEGVVSQGDVRIGGATARLLGRFNTRTATPAVQLTLAGHRMPVTDLQAILPAIGATLPHGAHFRSGVIDVNVAARGAVDRLVIAGPIAMTDATLSGFDFGSRLQAMASLAGYRGNGETAIQTCRVGLRVAPDGTRADGLNCVVRSIGSVEGAGSIAPNGTLDFRMLARLVSAAGAGGQLARVASLGHPEHGMPFRITGTTASPVFVPDVGRAASNAIKDPGTIAKAGGFMRSLFGKKR
jgi:AsmA protein